MCECVCVYVCVRVGRGGECECMVGEGGKESKHGFFERNG